MTSHVTDEIPSMLRGDALRQEALANAAHLRVCSDCRDELVSALVGHIALTSTARLLRETETRGQMISAADRESAANVGQFPFDGSSDALTSVNWGAPLPDLSEFAVRSAPNRGRRRIALAIAAGVVAAAGVAGALLPHGSAARSVALSAYGTGTSNASAEMVGSANIGIRSNLPPLTSGSYYEVWLTDPARTVMTPVGQLASSGSTNLSLSLDVVSRFADIEVSVQSSGDGSDYSGVSVLRGQYNAE